MRIKRKRRRGKNNNKDREVENFCCKKIRHVAVTTLFSWNQFSLPTYEICLSLSLSLFFSRDAYVFSVHVYTQLTHAGHTSGELVESWPDTYGPRRPTPSHGGSFGFAWIFRSIGLIGAKKIVKKSDVGGRRWKKKKNQRTKLAGKKNKKKKGVSRLSSYVRSYF